MKQLIFNLIFLVTLPWSVFGNVLHRNGTKKIKVYAMAERWAKMFGPVKATATPQTNLITTTRVEPGEAAITELTYRVTLTSNSMFTPASPVYNHAARNMMDSPSPIVTVKPYVSETDKPAERKRFGENYSSEVQFDYHIFEICDAIAKRTPQRCDCHCPTIQEIENKIENQRSSNVQIGPSRQLESPKAAAGSQEESSQLMERGHVPTLLAILGAFTLIVSFCILVIILFCNSKKAYCISDAIPSVAV